MSEADEDVDADEDESELRVLYITAEGRPLDTDRCVVDKRRAIPLTADDNEEVDATDVVETNAGGSSSGGVWGSC